MPRYILICLLAVVLGSGFGCAMKSSPPPVAAPPAPTAPVAVPADDGEQPAADATRAGGQPIVEEQIAASLPMTVTIEPLTPLQRPTIAGLKAVPFAYDQHLLDDEARAILSDDAELLKAQPQARFRLAGHSDERGSDQYNIALGERRAEAVRSYLVELGIVAGRMETVSFGEEQPRAPGHDESAWALNRRVEFVVLPK